MELHNLEKIKGIRRKKKIIGRGIGSGKGGHTVGRGQKGQNSREGHKHSQGFEGGQTPLYKKLPQIGGFRNPMARIVVTVDISRLNFFKEGAEITPKVLVEKNIIKEIGRHTYVKILGSSNLKKKLVLKGFLCSERAKEEIQKSGSTLS
jgi:large subunit ribosomal protein L15